MDHSRRNFIRNSALITAGTTMIPGFLKALEKNAGHATQKKLVVIQLSGGNDGLNTIVPYRNDQYFRLRPSLHIPANEVLAVTDELGFHPALAPLRSVFDEGKMAILNSVGYPNPDRSHFRSMEIWQTASDADEYLSTGWLGRFLDASCSAGDGAQLGIEVNDVLSPALKGERIKGLAMQNPQRLYDALHNKMLQHLATGKVSGNEQLSYLYKTLAESYSASEYLYEKYRIRKSNSEYPPTEFSRHLKTVAQLIQSGADTQVYYVSLSGFDTHVRQRPSQQRLLSIYAEGVAAFIRDLQRYDSFSDVMILTFSEFGRRVEENASGGTDHGTANNIFIMGDRLRKSGFVNETPDLTALIDGDLVYTIDFREIYATLLDKWLNIESRQVLSRSFNTLDFI